jgi:hypothetical protein
VDPNRPVVKLCAQGMEAEMAGRDAEARALFLQAWAEREDAFDACIAAHYVARHQDTPEDTLRWNQLALSEAEAVGDARVHGFYSSLYLNLGHSHEVLGDLVSARRYYALAAERLGEVPDGRYRDMVAQGIDGGRRRVETMESTVPVDSPMAFRRDRVVSDQ